MMAIDWSRRTFLSAAGAGLLPRPLFARLLAPAETASAQKARLAEIEAVANRGPFKPSWESLEGFKVPDWYQDGKFGIFIHWGVYSVPAFGNEWYPRNMYKAGTDEFKHHVATFGRQARFGYKDFIPRFKAERFDAHQWAALFRQAGAKFVVPVAEHHDGFPMYAYPYTEWSAAKMGPKRDTVGELANAVRKAGLVFGASSHRAEHWWFFDQGMTFDSDVRDQRYAGLYGPARDQKAAESQAAPPDQAYLDDWLLRTCDLVDRHRPQLVWFDWWIAQPAFQSHLKTFAAFYYNRGAEWKQGVAINYKKHGGESFPDAAGVLDVERGGLAAIRPYFWQTDTAVAKNSWGYTTKQDYKTANSIVEDLVDIVSKNGALLLNIGPRPDGTIPEGDEALLREIGGWLGACGEAVYGTRPWKVFGEGPTEVVAGPFADTKRKPFTAEDIRFTAKAQTLYATALAWPESRRIVVRSLARPGGQEDSAVAKVDLIGHVEPISWEQTAEGLIVTLPVAPSRSLPLALRIGFAATP
jgi:alpha-L-fucosidase